MGDYKVADWAIDQWNRVTDKSLFMTVGFFRPLQVPKPWFDQFPLDSIRHPTKPDGVDDWDDMPEFAQRLARTHAHKALHEGLSDHEYIVANDRWDATIQAYHASIAFVDRQIGRFVQSLKENPRGRETYIMLVSDHGWHLGEKKHWCKGAIWEQTTHIPFIVRGPGIKAGSICSQPVSLIDAGRFRANQSSRLARRIVHQSATRQAIGRSRPRDFVLRRWQHFDTHLALALHPLRRRQRRIVRPPSRP